MKNLLPRTLWGYLLGALVGAVMTVVALVIVSAVSGALESRINLTYRTLYTNLTLVGVLVFLSALLVVTLYEVTLLYRARGRILEGNTEARLLTREPLLRALTSGVVAGLYSALVVLAFAPLARGAFIARLEPGWVYSLGLLPPLLLVAALALSYTFAGADVDALQGETYPWERIFLLALPLALGVLLGLIFGAAAAGVEGIVKALLGALLTYGLVHRLMKLRGHVLARALTKLLNARGAPTIEVVSHHRA